MKLEGFVRVHNNSGEEYEDAQVRLVVGTINLVEKIAQLAQVPLDAVKNMQADGFAKYKGDAIRATLALEDRFGVPAQESAPKEIIKEGLSEYFIFTIEGTETIPNGWSKRLRSIEAAAVPLKIQYR